MSQFSPEDSQGNIDFVSDGDVTLESDRNQDGVGDLVFRTAGVERARIAHDGTGTGWSNVLGGSITATGDVVIDYDSGNVGGHTLTIKQGGNVVEEIDVESSATTHRIQPPVAVPTTSSNGAILTLLSAPFQGAGVGDTTFTDWKLSFDGGGVPVIHLLGDRTGANLAPSVFTVELDPHAQTSAAEFEVITGSFRGGAGTQLLDIKQETGITAIAKSTIDLGAALTIKSGLNISGGIAMDGATLNAARINMPSTWGIQVGGTDALIFTSGGTVTFSKAAIALGGGATATLGTIGGSGPGTAAQNAWLEIGVAGTNAWIPIWR